MSTTHIVETVFGNVRGADVDGVQVFKGIRYGADPGGNGRFLPPTPPEPWPGVQNALEPGPMAIQPPSTDETYNEVFAGLVPLPPIETSEDCLFLNVWTPGTSGRRPVMVWLHAGGWKAWGGYSAWCDGERLARRQDVVVVSINHRLNVFGHLYVADMGGAEYADSGSAGLLDLVLALRWIRDNIAAFGGDPDNVTLFGEGGGAPKVSALLAMPPAKGLIHKAIVQTNPLLRTATVKDSLAMTAKFCEHLGGADLAALRTLPAATLLQAAVETGADDFLFPTAAGQALPSHPFDPVAPDVSSDVPMMIGTTVDEAAYFLAIADQRPLTDDASLERLLVGCLEHWGVDDDEAARMIEAYRRLHPKHSLRECFVGIGTQVWRDDALIQAERKMAQGGASVFMYLFRWRSPAFGGRHGACHTFEVPFVFDNLHAAPQLLGDEADRALLQNLADNMSRAWASFARTGDPSHPDIGDWAPYEPKTRPTMVFGVESGQELDPQSAERKAFLEFRTMRLAKAAKRHIGFGRR